MASIMSADSAVRGALQPSARGPAEARSRADAAGPRRRRAGAWLRPIVGIDDIAERRLGSLTAGRRSQLRRPRHIAATHGRHRRQAARFDGAAASGLPFATIERLLPDRVTNMTIVPWPGPGRDGVHRDEKTRYRAYCLHPGFGGEESAAMPSVGSCGSRMRERMSCAPAGSFRIPVDTMSGVNQWPQPGRKRLVRFPITKDASVANANADAYIAWAR